MSQAPEALRGFQPELALEVHELGAHARGELLHASGPALARVALALLREARAERDFEALWQAALGLVPELLGAWGAGFGLMARYTLHQAGRDVMARVQDEVLREHGREAAAPFVSAAEALRAEGFAEGRAAERATRAAALRQATLEIVEERLGRAARERVAPVVAAATLEELEVLVVRAAIIRAPDELGPPTRSAP